MSMAALLSVSTTLFADTDEPPLFVSESGHDIGSCQTQDQPCQSLGYALSRVGKNGQIRVGNGSFEMTDVSDVVYILSGAIDVQASYGEGQRSTLVGAPSEFAAALEAKGFRVVVDTKGLHQSAVDTQTSVQANAFATACVGGLAGSFPCDNVDLLAHVSTRTPGARGADIWGFVDLNTNREYAIVGYSTGTAVFDVSDAENPIEIGFIDGQRTTWRDIKVHQFWNANDARWNAYAYITADNASDGLFIIDLSDLPHSISRTNYASDFIEAHNVYLSDVDFGTGLSITGDAPVLIIAGSNLSDGRFRAYSLADPGAPSFIAAPSTPANQPGGNRLYMHDAASMVVTDSRKDTQCVNAAGSDHCDILFDFNESTVDIWDITLPGSPARLSQVPYNNSAYTHSGWASEDQQYLYIQDELDERDRAAVTTTTLRALSIANLTSPTLVGSWSGPTQAIDHNGFVRGNRYYMSNYSRGLSILDLTNAANPTLVGRFDTYPASDGLGFPGNWGTYPFFPSGNVALSDIDSGFYMVADNTLNVLQGTLSFSQPAFGADETQSLDLTVSRSGGSQGAVSTRWELLGATADAADVVVNSGTLSWGDGDSNDKTISLVINDDGVAEGLEQLFVKLIAPTGGATLSSPAMASAFIGDAGDTTVVEFSNAAISVSERGAGIAVATIRRLGSATGSLSVDYNIISGDASNGTDYSGATSGTLTWADGDANPKNIDYSISDDSNGEADEFFELELSGAIGGTVGAVANLRVNIIDGSNRDPNAVAGPNQNVGSGARVTLSASASNDPDGDTLSYSWSQIQGPAVTLSAPTSESTSFDAPTVTSDALLRFELEVTDPSGLSDTATVNVTVGSTATSGGGGGVFSLLTLLALLGAGVMRRRDVL